MIEDAIIRAEVCPYCGGKPEYVDSAEVYSRSFGMIYLCRPCHAWVGVHKGTNRALGRLANSDLRMAKKAAHDAFDSLWMAKVANGTPKHEARGRAYGWLAAKMAINPAVCHIGMMDVVQCQEVVQIVNELLESIKLKKGRAL